METFTQPNEQNPNYNNAEMNSLSISNSNGSTDTTQPVSMPVLTVKNSRVIRQAKNIRTDAQNQNVPLDIPKTMVPSPKTNYNNTPKTEYINYAQPPPYHIAAQRSQFFNSLTDCNECVSLTTQNAKYSNMKKEDYGDNTSLPHEQVSLTNIQDSNLDNDTYHNLSSFYEDIKTDYTKNNFCNNLQNQNDYKPRNFIQDKPSPSEYIVAPTPKRPVSLEGNQFYNKDMVNNHPTNGNIYSSATDSPEDNKLNYSVEMDNKAKSITMDNSPNSPSNSALKWAFGPHKNATVKQVTIQRNTDLGFSISQKHGHVSYLIKS